VLPPAEGSPGAAACSVAKARSWWGPGLRSRRAGDVGDLGQRGLEGALGGLGDLAVQRLLQRGDLSRSGCPRAGGASRILEMSGSRRASASRSACGAVEPVVVGERVGVGADAVAVDKGRPQAGAAMGYGGLKGAGNWPPDRCRRPRQSRSWGSWPPGGRCCRRACSPRPGC
jgi:hypothetical protein